MSRYNTAATGRTNITENLAGGKAFKQTPELELASILLTSFMKDQYYRSANDTNNRLKDLIAKCDPEFAAKAIVYARTQFGMRTITHFAASELAKHLAGKEWGKKFYDKIVYRPDDMLEIVSAFGLHAKKGKNGKAVIPNAMKKGFASAIGRFDSYSLAKYRGEGKGVKLIDIVNAVHPPTTERNKEALELLIKGKLKSTDTWESMLTKAGQNAENEDEKAKFKKEAWVELIKEKKIKYFALLRNLRNIIEQAPEVIEEACEMLVDEKAIKRSLVLPFRFVTAYREIEKMDGKIGRRVLKALNDAVDISLNNVPKFLGETLVVIDVSGSMDSPVAGGVLGMRDVASLFASILGKASDADIMIFGSRAKYVPFQLSDSTMSITKQIMGYNRGGYGSRNGAFEVDHGTCYPAIFQEANKKYDRVIIFSDGQGWMNGGEPSKEYASYKNKFGAKPQIYSVDLAGYGSMMFPQRNVFTLAGFSDKIFKIMQLFEQDKTALMSEILKTEL